MKLLPGVHGREPPFDGCRGLVSFGLQGSNFDLEYSLISNATIQTLFSEDAELNLCHIEPASVLGSMVQYGSQSSGPLEIDRPWDAYSDDQLGLMDHLGIQKCGVLGFCIAGPMMHNLIRLAPERFVAAAMMQPSRSRPEIPDLFYQNNIKGWGPPLCEKRPEITMDMVHNFLTSMYTDRADFVFTVSRDFVRSIQTPLLIVPDDVTAHLYKVAMEVASLAPNAEVTIYPGKIRSRTSTKS